MRALVPYDPARRRRFAAGNQKVRIIPVNWSSAKLIQGQVATVRLRGHRAIDVGR